MVTIKIRVMILGILAKVNISYPLSGLSRDLSSRLQIKLCFWILCKLFLNY